jgi:hypothetical protein
MVPPAPFRDANHKMKPQAARFRVYEYSRDEFGQEKCVREVSGPGVVIDWTIHLVNSKAAAGVFPPSGTNTEIQRNAAYDRAALVIDGSVIAISGQSVGPVAVAGKIAFIKNGVDKGNANVTLGTLRTDDQGRLVLVGGPGVSASPMNSGFSDFANNDGWYDSVSDGPVTAVVTLAGQPPVKAEGGAWALVAPPSYAPGIDNVTTWYDQAVNVNATYFEPGSMTDKPSFNRDIFPILKRTVLISFVASLENRYHSGTGNFLKSPRFDPLTKTDSQYKTNRERIFNSLQKPNEPAPGTNSSPNAMPKLYTGIDPRDPSKSVYTALTQRQYDMMKRWANGDFIADWNGSEPEPVPLDLIPLEKQPMALTRAALEGCIGGAFFPGIETTYLMAQVNTYYEPFRIDKNHPPGFLTERMALPWQADFSACSQLWWPAQRPDAVITLPSGTIKDFARGIDSYGAMVKWWTDLGFVVQKGDQYVEEERLPINGES